MAAAAPLVITAARVWDGRSTDLLHDGFVRVDGGTITAIGRRADLGAADRDTVDLGDATLLPGLINAHTHVTFNAKQTVLDDYLREQKAGVPTLTLRAVDSMRRALAVGVTTIRDLGTVNEVAFAVRQAVADGVLPGPRVLASGRGITTTGGHCWFVGVEADNADDVRRAVRAQFKAGADVIKVFATGGNMTPGTNLFAPQYTAEEIAIVVSEAHRLGLRVAAHAHGIAGVRNSVAAGVDTIEHGAFLTPKGPVQDDALAERLADAGIQVTCTLGASTLRLVRDPSLRAGLPPQMRAFIDLLPELGTFFRWLRGHGVSLVSGSDAGIAMRPFDDYPVDVATLTDPRIGPGFSGYEALVAATSGAARACGLDDTGILAPGKRADLLGVAGDPLANVADLARTRFVACGGRVAVGADLVRRPADGPLG